MDEILESPAENDLYICPICGRGFTSEFLNCQADNNTCLTLEHVPQDDYGGIERILTCKQCNSELGDTIDPVIRSDTDSIVLLNSLPNYKVRAKLRLNLEKDIHVTVHKESETHNILIHEGAASNGYLFSKIVEVSKLDEWNFDIRSKPVDRNDLARVHLKNAFLILFEHFGYPVIIGSASMAIRRFIRYGVAEPDIEKSRESMVIELSMNSELGEGVYLLINCGFIECYMVCYDVMVDSVSRRFVVFLPRMGAKDLSIYQKLPRWLNSVPEKGEIKIANLHDFDYLTSEIGIRLVCSNFKNARFEYTGPGAGDESEEG